MALRDLLGSVAGETGITFKAMPNKKSLGSGRSYDAFISYSHSQDRGLSKALQRTIERWGSPVPGRRRLRVCRDESNLAADPDLWEAIRNRLDQSRYFVLMASPASARSPWVTKEVMHFVANNEEARQRIGIVLTDGALGWLTDDEPSVAERAIAPEVVSLFAQQPLIVDLRDFRHSQSSPEYFARVATLVAAIVGKDKDEVFGEHLTAQRRFIMSLVGGIAVLSLAIVLAVVQYLRANEQAAEAKRQAEIAKRQAEIAATEAENAKREALRADRAAVKAADAAEEAMDQARRADRQTILANQETRRADARAREATSRRLAAEIDRLVEARIDTALLLMAQGHRMADNTAIRSSWWRLLGAHLLPSAFLPVAASRARFEPDGRFVATLADGTATFLEGDGGWRRDLGPVASEQLRSAATWQWSGSCEEEAAHCACSRTESRIIGPYGDQADFCIASELTIPGWCSDQPFEVPGVEVVIQRDGSAVHVQTDRGQGEYACLRPSPAGDQDGRRPTLVAGSSSFFAGRDDVDRLAAIGPPSVGVAQSHDGRWLAMLREGGIEMWLRERIPTTTDRWGVTAIELPSHALTAAASSGGEAVVVALSSPDERRGGDLVLWRGLAVPDLPQPPGQPVHGVWSDQGQGGALALSPDGGWLAAGIQVDLLVWNTSDLGKPPRKLWIGRKRATSASFSADGTHLVATLGLAGASPSAEVFSVEGERSWGPFAHNVRAASFHPTDDDGLVTVGAEGVQLWSLSKQMLTRDLLTEPAVALAADRGHGRLAVRLVKGDIAIWDLKNGGPPVRSGKREGSRSALAFVSNADALLWASERGLEAWYWLEDTWFKIDDRPHRGGVGLGNGSVLGVTEEGQAVVYDLDPTRWLDQTCRLVGRNLTHKEWSAHIGVAFPYECVCREHGPGAGWPEGACARAE